MQQNDGTTYVSSQLFHWICAQGHAEHLPHACWVTRPRRITQTDFVASHVQQLLRHVPHALVVYLAAVRACNHDTDIPSYFDAFVQGTSDDARQALQ